MMKCACSSDLINSSLDTIWREAKWSVGCCCSPLRCVIVVVRCSLLSTNECQPTRRTTTSIHPSIEEGSNDRQTQSSQYPPSERTRAALGWVSHFVVLRRKQCPSIECSPTCRHKLNAEMGALSQLLLGNKGRQQQLMEFSQVLE